MAHQGRLTCVDMANNDHAYFSIVVLFVVDAVVNFRMESVEDLVAFLLEEL